MRSLAPANPLISTNEAKDSHAQCARLTVGSIDNPCLTIGWHVVCRCRGSSALGHNRPCAAALPCTPHAGGGREATSQACRGSRAGGAGRPATCSSCLPCLTSAGLLLRLAGPWQAAAQACRRGWAGPTSRLGTACNSNSKVYKKPAGVDALPAPALVLPATARANSVHGTTHCLSSGWVSSLLHPAWGQAAANMAQQVTGT